MNSKTHLHELDLLRFLAALAVVFFHLAFRGFSADNLSMVAYPEISEFARYGYLGVNVFFIISGFVIFMSLENRSAKDFFFARAIRLFPSLWLCCLLACVGIWYFSGFDKLPDLKTLFANLFLLVDYVDLFYIDGSYWSLYVEVNFYFLIYFVLLFKKEKHLERIIYFWLFLAVVNYFFEFGGSGALLLRPKYAAYFIAGAVFYLVYKSGFNRARFLALLVAYIAIIFYSFRELESIETYYKIAFSRSVVAGVLSVFYLLFVLLAMKKTQFLKCAHFKYLGLCTYPLYLLHQRLGYLVLNHFHEKVERFTLLILLIISLCLVSYLIAAFYEKPLMRFSRMRFRLG